MPSSSLTRREWLSASALAAAQVQGAVPDSVVVAQHDKGVDSYLAAQVTDRRNRWFGRIPDATGLHQPGTAAGTLLAYVAAYLSAQSRFHKSTELRERIRLSADALAAAQNEHGNFDLLITNFNSPPDTAFIIRSAASAALLARRAGEGEFLSWLEPLLRKAGDGMVSGGVHTPNHRWVVCAALAQLYELDNRDAYLRRIDQWLAESIDLDEDGQFSERSTLVYNPVVCSALVVIANKLNRPALLDPVRQNLNALLYLLEPGHEAITDISRRQDQYSRGKPDGSWFALRYLANRDGNGQFATLADQLTPSLPLLMEHPELLEHGPERRPLPDDYSKLFPSGQFAHIRRGRMSAHVLLQGYSRFLGMRRGEADIPAIRVAAAFFGKGQFVASAGRRLNSGAFVLEQRLTAGYYQPFRPPRKVPPGVQTWYELVPQRPHSERCEFHYGVTVRETSKGIALRVEAGGTRDVPVAIEVNLKPGGRLEGCTRAPDLSDAFILEQGFATYSLGGDSIRFGPGRAEHRYTQIRGAQPKLAGPSVYICGYAPFDYSIEFELK
ncbi:MAG: hypothetical protein ACKV22_28510 [Bryobacteraceae bacterium]